MNKIKLAVLLVFTSMAFGHAQIAAATEIEVAENNRIQKLFLESSCVIDISAGLSPFLAPLVPGLIDSAVGSIIGAVKKAGEDSTTTIVTGASDFFYVLNAKTKEFALKNQCLTIFVGSSKDDPKRTPPAAAEGDTSISGAIENIVGEYLDYAPEIDVLIELRVESSPDYTAFRLAANALYVGNYVHKARSSRARNYLVTVELRRPGADSDSVHASIALPVVTGAEKETYFSATQLDDLGIRSRWIPYPTLSDSSKAQHVTYKDLLAAEEVIKSQRKKRASCAGANSLSDECVRATYPSITDIADITAIKKLLEERAQHAKALADAQLADLNETERAVHELNAIEGHIASRLATSTSTLSCKKFDARTLQVCLGSAPDGGPPRCDQPAVQKCEFPDGATGGAEFMEWSAALTETRPGSPFMKKLGEILESGESGIKNELKERFDPATIAEQATAAETVRKENVSLLDQLRIKQQEIELKTLELAAATGDAERLQIEFDIVNKKHAANELARQLNIPAPYPDL